MRVAFSASTAILRRDLWMLDLATGERRQLTAAAGDNHSPLWSPDGVTLTFASSRAGPQRILRMQVASAATPETLVGGDQRTPGSWSPDGRRLAFHEVHPDRGRDTWMWLDRSGETAAPWLATGANERVPAFSPDGRWIAYVSDLEAGVGDQVYIKPADRGVDRVPLRVSPVGGTEPVWAAAEPTLYYRQGRALYRAEIQTDPLRVGRLEHLFDGRFLTDPLGNLPAYDVAPDGERFVMVELAGRVNVIHLLSGWQPSLVRSPGD